MYISGIHVEGFADLHNFTARGLGRCVGVQGPGPAATALGDALELAFAALDAGALRRLLARWELTGPDEEPEIIGDPFPEQALWRDREAAATLVAHPETRQLQVRIEIVLDPIQYGSLRALAAREPRLVAGLGRGATAELGVGALFATSFDAVALNIQGVTIGGECFSADAGTRAPWLTRFLLELRGRLSRHPSAPGDPDAASRALNAATSRAGYDAWLRWAAALGPELGVVRAARGAGGRAVLLSDDRPLRRHGPAAQQRAELAAAVHLSGADLVWLESDDDWAERFTDGDGSALEQVFRVHAAGDLSLDAEPTSTPTVGVIDGPRLRTDDAAPQLVPVPDGA